MRSVLRDAIRWGAPARRVVLALLWVSAFTLASACGRDQQAQRGGTVVIAEGADLDKPHPILLETALDNQVSSILYRPLLQPWWENGQLSYLTAEQNPMALARSYELFGPDSASLRYRLRTDVRWTDAGR
jgi:hypothetical protein